MRTKERGRNHFPISRRALAPVGVIRTGASALRLRVATLAKSVGVFGENPRSGERGDTSWRFEPACFHRHHFPDVRKMVGVIEEQGWSLNPGRYVGVAEGEAEDFDFTERLKELNEELEVVSKPDCAVATFARTWGFRWFAHVLANVATERLEELNEELETLNGEAHELEERIAANVATILEGAA